MRKIKKKIILLPVIILLLAIAYFGFQFFNNKLASLESQLKQNFEQNQLLNKQVQTLFDAYAEFKEKSNEIVRREVIKEKSQEELLTEAVSRIAPAVVSIMAAKDVPQYEIVYINPFGDDPFFKDFDIRVPQYRQKGTTEQKVGAATGFLVSSNGYIVTNRHVVEDQNARYSVLLNNGNQKQAEVVYRDNEIDVAIIKIEGSGYSFVNFGSSNSLKLGQSVFAVGNALGEYNNSVSVGIISGLNRDIQAFGGSKTEKLQGVIQTDAAINPGNSGGPLVNLSGEVIGINVAVQQGAENIGFALPIDPLKPIISAQIK